MESYTIINSRGERVILGYNPAASPYILEREKQDGLTSVGIEAFTARGYGQHGATFQYQLLEERVIPLSFHIVAETAQDIYTRRRAIEKVINPVLGDCEIIYVNNTYERRILAHCTQMPKEQQHHGTVRKYSVEFTASFPFWESANEHVKHMNEILGGFKFPFKFNPFVRFGTIGNVAHIDNDGDAPCPVKMEIGAGAINPRLTLQSTGQYIKIDGTVPAGYQYVINTGYGNKTVRKIQLSTGASTDMFGAWAAGSTFFQIPLGRQVIKYSSEDGNIADVYIRWRNLYAGI